VGKRYVSVTPLSGWLSLVDDISQILGKEANFSQEAGKNSKEEALAKALKAGPEVYEPAALRYSSYHSDGSTWLMIYPESWRRRQTSVGKQTSVRKLGRIAMRRLRARPLGQGLRWRNTPQLAV